jgi:glycosyltransferase involved in cell wall biosynthesis
MLPDDGAGQPTGQPVALYVGDLRASRGLFAMLEALRAAPAWVLRLVGPVAPGDQLALDALMADDAALKARLELTGRQPPRQAWRGADGAWAGLLLLDQTAAFADAMPSKLYEYLACGLPVITTALRRPAELIRATGAGQVVADAAEAGAVLRHWSDDPAEYASVKAAAMAARGAVLAEPDTMARLARRVKALAAT